MNKQELINELTEYVERYEDTTDEYDQGKSSAYEVALKLVKKLEVDEPQKPVVPMFIAELIKQGKKQCFTLYGTMECANLKLFTDSIHREKCKAWLLDWHNQETFARAWLYGYEVEKEPLYYVYFPEIIASPEMFFPDIEGAYLMKSDDGIELADNNDFEDMKFTEREIKAIDERYWAFAVPVEEVGKNEI